MAADITQTACVFAVNVKMLKARELSFSAMLALQMQFCLIVALGIFDTNSKIVVGRATDDKLLADAFFAIGLLAFARQRHRVAFAGYFPAVNLITEQDADWHGRQSGGAIRATDEKLTSRELLFQNGIGAATVLKPKLGRQCWRVAQHRRDALLAETLRHRGDIWLNTQYRAWVAIDGVANQIVD